MLSVDMHNFSCYYEVTCECNGDASTWTKWSMIVITNCRLNLK